MAGAERIELPIFELPLVLLPSEQLPLHIFEERYKRMTAFCQLSGEAMGIVLRTDDGTRTRGCAAELSETLETFEDGRLNILVTGAWRFDVLDRYEGEEFPMASVERLVDEPDPDAEPGAARDAFRELLEAVGSEAELPEDADSAYELAARVEIPLETKQQLLESDSETARLELLRESLGRLVEEVGKTREVAERARSNGHAPIERS